MEHLNPSNDALMSAIADVATTTLGVMQLAARVLGRLDAGQQARYAARLNFFQRSLEESLQTIGVRLVVIEGGHPYDPGIPARPLNLEDFSPADALVVDRMLEPIVMGPNGVLRSGTLILRKA